MSSSKPRVVKDYEKLDPAVREMIKLHYPFGFEENLVSFVNAEGKKVSALPFETDDRYYLVRMTVAEAQSIIEDDEDYDEDGNLTDEAREEYEDKYDDVDVADEVEVTDTDEADDADDDVADEDGDEDDDDKE
ncbi:MAG: hypothetical protein K9J17_02305 [Flavobacteriales bacterium]|nr:hypothetical protein [Flavobacteriales bacterium]